MIQKSIDGFLEEKKSNKRKRKAKVSRKKNQKKSKDLSYYEDLLRMYREIGHAEGEVDTHLEIALFNLKGNARIRALEAAEKARLASEGLNDERETTALLLVGDIRYLMKDRENAKESWILVLDHQETTEEQRLGACLRLAVLANENDDDDFNNWIQLAEDISGTPEAAVLRGMRRHKEQRLAEAEEWFLRALGGHGIGPRPLLFKEIPILPCVSDNGIFRRIGELREEIGNLREASDAYERAGDFMSQGRVLRAFGNLELALLAYETGRMKTGKPGFILKQAEIVFEMGNDKEALNILRSGEKELEKKDPDLLIQALDLEMNIHEKRGGPMDQAEVLEKRGKTYETLQELDGMAESFLRAAEILEKIDDEHAWTRAVKNMEKVIESAAKRGKVNEEMSHRLRLEEMHLRKGKPVNRIYKENVGYCYSLRRPELAVEFLQRELRLHKGREKEFLDYLHLARAHLSGGRNTEARAVYLEALKYYSDPVMKGTIYRELGCLLRVSGDTERAMEALNNALSFYRRAKNKEGRVKTLTELEKVYDDVTAMENMERSGIIGEMNKITSAMDKLTEEASRLQKIIRETTKLVDEHEREVREWKGLLEQMRTDTPNKPKQKIKHLEKMDKLGIRISKQEENIITMQGIIRENQAKKLKLQDEKVQLKIKLREKRKKDTVMKKKIESIEAKAKEFREQAKAIDPMLSTSAKLETIEEDIYHQLASGTVPRIRIPTRTKDNIEFSEIERVYRYSSGLSFRSAKATDGANMLMRTAYIIDFINDMIRSSLKGKTRSSTLRELYYISESWGKLAKFGTQNESNNLVEDLEIITRYLRENFHLRPEEDGARVIGNITLREKNRKGEWKTINCREDVGDSGYTIPYNAEKEKLVFKEVDADFVIAIETGGMFDRLVENGFDESARAVLVHIKGQPARSTRRFLKRLNEETRLPVLVFTDGDPWSYRIFASIAYGAIKTAHISHHLATPSSEFVGITPSDIITYDLPTDKLSDRDIEALNSELTDPRFSDAFWQGEINTQLKIRKKSEQQALAKYGLDFVTDTYLPEKLGEMGYIY